MLEVLSRVQFGFTVGFHFLFVPLTIGLILFIAIFETKYYKTDDLKYKKLSDYFSNIFIINYAFGVVTGIVLTVQFGTNWSAYTYAMGEVFGTPLILEALIAFFLESTFAGIWTFKRDVISKRFRLVTVWLIVIGVTFSALWIITANGFMQNPIGGEMIDGVFVVTDFLAIVLNPYAWYMLIHNHISALLLSSFIVMIISLSFIHKKKNVEIFDISLKLSLWVLLITSILSAVTGFIYMDFIQIVQPDKIKMITEESTGLAAVVKMAFHFMTTTGTIYVLMGLYGVLWYKRLKGSKTFYNIMKKLFLFPYLTIMSGWMVAEMGRQPWIIYNYMKVSEGISQVPVSQVWFSFISLVVLYIFLGIMDFYLSVKNIKKGI